MPLVNLTLCPGTWRSVPFISLGWGCWCRCLCHLSSSELFSGSHLNAVQLPPLFWHSFAQSWGGTRAKRKPFHDHIQEPHPQLCWGCSAVCCQQEQPQGHCGHCGHSPKNLHGHSDGRTLTRTRDEVQRFLVEIHVPRFGLLVPSCQNRFWSSWHMLKTGRKKGGEGCLSLTLLNWGIVPPIKPLSVLLLVLYIWNLHAEKQVFIMKVKNTLIQLKEVSICSCKVKSSKLFCVQKTAGYTWMNTSFVALPKYSHLSKQISRKKDALFIKATALQPPPAFPY